MEGSLVRIPAGRELRLLVPIAPGIVRPYILSKMDIAKLTKCKMCGYKCLDCVYRVRLVLAQPSEWAGGGYGSSEAGP